ncbi:hypothetical protein ABMY26_30505 [Azospirillum sp. HJ39]|uniref:hypothetical protein n=1 Tax=Azospirillum sp. HJ39 TaxID=3159496 RepID=UPI0035583D43
MLRQMHSFGFGWTNCCNPIRFIAKDAILMPIRLPLPPFSTESGRPGQPVRSTPT